MPILQSLVAFRKAECLHCCPRPAVWLELSESTSSTSRAAAAGDARMLVLQVGRTRQCILRASHHAEELCRQAACAVDCLPIATGGAQAGLQPAGAGTCLRRTFGCWYLTAFPTALE